MNLAPIVYLAYNRPKHTLITLEALSNNELAKKSSLYVVCDGPKENATQEDLKNIAAVRAVVRGKNWCKENNIIERERNLGMADSTVFAITQIINLFGKVIVLEDDILISPHLLNFLNDGLNHLESNLEISSINAYAEDFVRTLPYPDYYLLTGADCWGWATWKNRWDDLIYDPSIVMQKLIETNKLQRFEYGGMVSILNKQIAGKLSTWDMQWCASNVLKDRKALYPKISFVKNIGFDGTGTNGDNDGKQVEISVDSLNKYEQKLEKWINDGKLNFDLALENRFRKKFSSRLTESLNDRILRKLKSLFC